MHVVRQAPLIGFVCSIDGCGNTKFHALGFCRNHYYQHYKRQPTYLAYKNSPDTLELTRARERRRYYRDKGKPRKELKKRAYVAVHAAIKKGKIIPKPCEVCGSKAQAHHDSYLRQDWLSVRWLCPLHHSDWHHKNEPAYPPNI